MLHLHSIEIITGYMFITRWGSVNGMYGESYPILSYFSDRCSEENAYKQKRVALEATSFPKKFLKKKKISWQKLVTCRSNPVSTFFPAPLNTKTIPTVSTTTMSGSLFISILVIPQSLFCRLSHKYLTHTQRRSRKKSPPSEMWNCPIFSSIWAYLWSNLTGKHWLERWSISIVRFYWFTFFLQIFKNFISWFWRSTLKCPNAKNFILPSFSRLEATSFLKNSSTKLQKGKFQVKKCMLLNHHWFTAINSIDQSISFVICLCWKDFSGLSNISVKAAKLFSTLLKASVRPKIAKDVVQSRSSSNNILTHSMCLSRPYSSSVGSRTELPNTHTIRMLQ